MRQLLPLCFTDAFCIDFGRAECVEAQDALGLGRVGEHVNRTDAASAVLLGKAMEVLIKCRYAALESLPVVNRRIEWQVFKHAEPCGAPVSRLP